MAVPVREAYLAIDLGAESGRAIVGSLDLDAEGLGRALTLHECHRFLHRPLALPGGLFWDIGLIWREVVAGLKAAVAWTKEQGVPLASVGVDAWGVDYVLTGASGELVGLPRCYRDARHERGPELIRRSIDPDRVYAMTGIQPMAINTLSQLTAHFEAEPGLRDVAHGLMFVPDLVHYLLSGRRLIEACIASTSQMVDVRTGEWAGDLLRAVSIPERILGPTAVAGRRIGVLRPELASEIGAASDIAVTLPASHDTASAVAAVPASPDSTWCYLSSGTWSLLGAELDEPCLIEAAREEAFTNERGVGGTIRFLQNIIGLWPIQECRREWEARGEGHDYDELTTLASAAEPFRTRIDLTHPPLAAPGDMVEKLRAYAGSIGDPAPDSPRQVIRCCLEGLAMAYRRTLGRLESVLGRRFDVIHLVGGGGRNTLLNQMTADATGRRVVVGPYEATAVGNVLVQAMGSGRVRDRRHLRRIVADSFDLSTFEPLETGAWDAAAVRYDAILR